VQNGTRALIPNRHSLKCINGGALAQRRGFTGVDLPMNATEHREFCCLVAAILKLSPDDIRDDLTPENTMTWDSFTMVELVTGVEERYKLVLEFDDLTRFTSIGGVRRLLQGKGFHV
jgi:acyl carrier protein